MKSWRMLLVLMVLFVGHPFRAAAQNEIEVVTPAPVASYPNGVQTAMAFLHAGPTSALRCEYWFTAVGCGTNEVVSGEFILLTDGPQQGYISYMTFNGQVLVDDDDPPLPGFPFYSARPVEDFSISVMQKIGAGDPYGLSGWFYTQTLFPETPIVIEIHPNWRPYVLHYDGPINGPLYLRFDSARGSGGAVLDAQTRTFVFWVDPTVPFSYEIYNDEGIVVERGDGLFGHDQPARPGEWESALNLVYQDGVKPISFDSNESVYLERQLPTSVSAEGFSAATYFAFSLGSGLEGAVILPEEQLSTVRVKAWGFRAGSLESLSPVPVAQESWAWLISVPPGSFDGIIVEVVPVADVIHPFDLYLGRYGSPKG